MVPLSRCPVIQASIRGGKNDGLRRSITYADVRNITTARLRKHRPVKHTVPNVQQLHIKKCVALFCSISDYFTYGGDREDHDTLLSLPSLWGRVHYG